MNKRKKTARIFNEVHNIGEFLANIKTHGNKTLYRYVSGREYLSITYSDFCDMVKREAAGLSEIGLAGKRIAVIGETSPEWVCTYLAVLAIGGVVIPMDKELDVKEIEGFLTGVNAEAIVYGKNFNSKLKDAIAEHPTLTDCRHSLIHRFRK